VERVAAARCAPTGTRRQTLPELIDAARAHGAREFMAYQGQRWSYDRFFALPSTPWPAACRPR
jgi:hypothetical protein